MSNRNLLASAALLMLLAGCDLPQGNVTKVSLPEPESAGAKVMKDNCANCHAAPSPSVHTAGEWPNVIYRMQEHRRMNGLSLIAPEQQELLLDYLKRHAKG